MTVVIYQSKYAALVSLGSKSVHQMTMVITNPNILPFCLQEVSEFIK